MTGKEMTVKKIYALWFLGLMVLFGMASIFVFVQNHLPAKESAKTEVKSQRDTISFLELYPFEENEGETSEKAQNVLSFVRQYRKYVSRITNSTKTYLTTQNPFSKPFNNLANHALELSVGKVVFNGSNTFVKLPNGYLSGCFSYCPSPEAWENILDFSNWLKNREIPFVALITPDKADDSMTTFPAGVPHGYTQTLSEYKAFLDENAMTYIESKERLLSENDDFYSWFYRSDHHWNVQAAFVMAREMAGFLKDELGIPADKDALNEGNFKLTVYPDSFLGSYGKKLGDAWKEDLAVLYPNQERNFHVEIPGYGIDKTGRFEETLIAQDCLDPNATSYGAFLYGNYPLIHIENKNCQNGTKILVIKYSFANALCPYLANTVQYLDIIDPRTFDGSIRTYIEETKPDSVILCTGVVTEYDEETFQLK